MDVCDENGAGSIPQGIGDLENFTERFLHMEKSPQSVVGGRRGVTSRPCSGSGFLGLHVVLRIPRVPCMARIRRAVGWAQLASASVLVVLLRCRDLLLAGPNKKRMNILKYSVLGRF